MEKNPPGSIARRIASHYAFTPQGHILPQPVVSLNREGYICDVSRWESPDSMPGVEFYAGMLIPPMVNAHCHLELSAMRGAIPGNAAGFASFARAMSAIERDVPQRTRAIAGQDALMWNEGVGAVGDACNDASSFEVKRRSPVRYLNFLELFGLNARSCDPLGALAAQARALGLPWSITPHSTYSLQTEAFARAVAAGGQGYGQRIPPLSIHFMESPGERDLYEGRGELQKWYRERGFPVVDFAGMRSPARRIAGQVPADRQVMLIHNTFITEEDLDVLAAHFGERLTLVLCPRSNRYITGTLPPVELLRRKGVRIAVGTDSLASNSSLSMIGELREFPSVPLAERLRWATTDPLGASPLPGVALLTGFDPHTMQLLPSASARRL